MDHELYLMLQRIERNQIALLQLNGINVDELGYNPVLAPQTDKEEIKDNQVKIGKQD